MVDTVGNHQENSVRPPQEDVGGDGAYDDYDEIMEAESEEVGMLSDDSENELDQRNDDGEHLGDREEPVDDDDTNLADMMAQNSLDDFYVPDLIKDESGNYRDPEVEPILPRVVIMESSDDHPFVKTVISKLNRFVSKPMPVNAMKPFDCKSARPTTVLQFNRDLNRIIAGHGLTTSAVNDLLVLFRNHTEGLDLPLIAVDKIPFSSKVVTTNTIKTFIDPDPKDFTSDACRHECMVFRGMQLDPTPEKRHLRNLVDCSVLLRCLHCKSPRFSRCSHKDCRQSNVPYENCSPFSGKGHSHRFAMKEVYYRTIIGKLIQLYCLSQMEGFEDILKYEDLRIKKDGVVIDVLDGSEFIRQTRVMDENYQKVLAKFSAANNGQFLHQCSILLTLSYDGVVNFKRKLDSMWPLLTSVANCDPSHRAKMGTGMFLTMLHNAGIGSGIEKHMMDEKLVQELKKL